MSEGAYQMRTEYNASNQPVYVGLAVPGKAETDAAWQIVLYEYDESGNVTKKTFAAGEPGFAYKWSLRASYTYS